MTHTQLRKNQTQFAQLKFISDVNKDLTLKAKARTKDLAFKAKARTKDLTLKAKARTQDQGLIYEIASRPYQGLPP